MLPNLDYETNITLMSKLDKDITKENCRPIPLLNMDPQQICLYMY